MSCTNTPATSERENTFAAIASTDNNLMAVRESYRCITAPKYQRDQCGIVPPAFKSSDLNSISLCDSHGSFHCPTKEYNFCKTILDSFVFVDSTGILELPLLTMFIFFPLTLKLRTT